MKLIFIFLTAFFVTANGFACKRVYVKTDGLPFTSISNHTSWAIATSELQTAIDSLYAAGGGEVWVAEGKYYPFLTEYDTIPFYPRNHVTVFGGFAGYEISVGERQLSDIDTNGIIEPWEFAHQSILSGEMNYPLHILNGLGTDSTAILDGFVIEKGRYYGPEKELLTIFNTNSYEKVPEELEKLMFEKQEYFKSIVLHTKNNKDLKHMHRYFCHGCAYYTHLRNCTLQNNGGGVGYYSVLKSCLINNNITVWGSAGANYSILSNCVIKNNQCFGGEILINSNLYDCRIEGNYVPYGRIILNCDTIRNSNIINNRVQSHFSLIQNTYLINCLIANNNQESILSNCVVINCTLVANKKSNEANDITNCYLDNCIVWGSKSINNFHSTGFQYCALEIPVDGIGNIQIDTSNTNGPRFIKPSNVYGVATNAEELDLILNADWSLQSTSPCIDMGNNDLYNGPEIDLAGNTRIICGVIDMGAYENKSSVPPFGINYVEETTNRPIPAFMAYNTINEFTGDELYGNGLPLSLFPDSTFKYLYFKVIDSDTTEYGLDSLYIPPRPSDPAAKIDYPAEMLTEVASNTFWDATDVFTPIQNDELLTEYIPEAGNSEDTVTLKVEASDTSFAALNPQDLVLIPRPDTPAVAIHYLDEIITGVPQNAIWNISGSFTALTEGESITEYIPPSGEENVQTQIAIQATDTSFRSEYQEIDIPPRPAEPAAEINYPAEMLTEVAPNSFWNATGEFTPIQEEESITAYIPEAGNPEDTVTLKIEASDTSFAALNPQDLVIIPRPGTPDVMIDYPEEIVVQVPLSAEWDISGNYTELAEGESIVSYIPSTGDTSIFAHIIVPATDTSFHSAEQVLEIPARPAPPTNPIVNDDENTFGWDWSGSGYEKAGDYEHSLDIGMIWSVCPDNPLSVGNNDLPEGYVQVRVRASNEPEKERFHSEALLSDKPYTSINSIHSPGNWQTEISVYPTVTDDFIYCQVSSGQFSLKIFSVHGELLYLAENLFQLETLDFSGYKSGVYFLVISNEIFLGKTYKIVKL